MTRLILIGSTVFVMLLLGLLMTERPTIAVQPASQVAKAAQAYLPIPSAMPNVVVSTQNVTLPDERKVPILMYHYIRENPDPKDKLGASLSVSPTILAKQLAAIKAAGYSATTFSNLERGVPENPVILTFDDGYDDAAIAAKLLEDAGMRGVFYIVSEFLDKTGYLTSEQVKSIAAMGHEIGAHSVSHHELNRLSESTQRKEIGDSKAKLEALIGKTVSAFCYPAGKYNETTVRLVEEAGFKTATTTKYGIATGSDWVQSPYLLKRIRMTNAVEIQTTLR